MRQSSHNYVEISPPLPGIVEACSSVVSNAYEQSVLVPVLRNTTSQEAPGHRDS